MAITDKKILLLTDQAGATSIFLGERSAVSSFMSAPIGFYCRFFPLKKAFGTNSHDGFDLTHKVL